MIVCPQCKSTDVQVEFDLYIPGEQRTVYEVYCSCGYEGDPLGVDVTSPREFGLSATDLERVAAQAISWQALHEEWACSDSIVRREIASFAWSAFVRLMAVLDQPSSHIGEEVRVKSGQFPGDSDITERTVGSLRLQRVMCPGGEWYSIV